MCRTKMMEKQIPDYELSEREKADVIRGRQLLEESKDSPAMEEIRALLTSYGFVTDGNAENQAVAEKERHRRYKYYQSIKMLLQNYRRFRRTIEVYQEELTARVDQEDIGGVGNVGSLGSQGFFTRLASSLDLMSAYDERRAANRYEPKIRSCQYIEASLQALERGLKLYEVENPAFCKLLRVVYIDGPSRPTIQTVIEQLKITGSSTYYRQLETARKELSMIVFGHSLDKKQLFRILVALQQMTEVNSWS